jgi:hypothetical protein
LDAADCEVCHAQSTAIADNDNVDHTHQDFKVTLWNVDDHTAPVYQLGSHADPLTDSAEADMLTEFCLNCHDGDGAQAEADPNSPFTGSGAPPVKAADWATSSHNPDVNGKPMGCFGDGTSFGCHSSGHGSEKLTLLGPAPETPANSPDFSEQREGLCISCHDGSTSVNILTDNRTDGSQFDYDPAAPAAQTQYTAGGGYTAVNKRHDVFPLDQSLSGGILTCKDCHDPHMANATSKVVIPDDGGPRSGLALRDYAISN